MDLENGYHIFFYYKLNMIMIFQYICNMNCIKQNLILNHKYYEPQANNFISNSYEQIS